VVAVFEAIDKVFQKNTQQNTDTDGFLLGARYAAWTEISVLSDLDTKVVDTSLAKRIGLMYFKEFRDLQKAMGIDEPTFCAVLSATCDVAQLKQLIDTWSKMK